MATLREYFETDLREMSGHKPWTFSDASGKGSIEVTAKIAYNFEANAKYWYFYIPQFPDIFGILGALLSMPEVSNCHLNADGDGLHIQSGHSGYSDVLTTDTLQFTRRVHALSLIHI